MKTILRTLLLLIFGVADLCAQFPPPAGFNTKIHVSNTSVDDVFVQVQTTGWYGPPVLVKSKTSQDIDYARVSFESDSFEQGQVVIQAYEVTTFRGLLYDTPTLKTGEELIVWCYGNTSIASGGGYDDTWGTWSIQPAPLPPFGAAEFVKWMLVGLLCVIPPGGVLLAINMVRKGVNSGGHL